MGQNAASFLPKEEDLHNAAVEPICRKFLETRYRLLPYLYSAAYETHTTGLPLIRSLGLAFPGDEKAWATVDAYLFGPSLLVAPVFESGATSRSLTLPQGAWWNFWTGQQVQGGGNVTVEAPLDSMPLLVRAGAIVPTGPVKQYADEPSSEPVTLNIYPGADGAFTFYDDDGVSFANEHGDFEEIAMRWDDGSKTLTLRRGKGSRTKPRAFRAKLAGGGEKNFTLAAGSVSVKLS
jgi:alpha-glucosidase/alpha-D-xyloside xylohydrolase